MIGMILVNNPGTWSAIYPPLRHAEWHGCTPTDLIFPFFLFIVGVAIPMALEPRIASGISRSALLIKVAKRSVVLFLLGLGMAAYPFLQLEPDLGLRAGAWERLRYFGVLQRIALCYAAAATIFLFAPRRGRALIVIVLLFGSWAAMTLIPAPGYGPGLLDQPEAVLSAWLDRELFGEAHLWAGAGRRWDPEGLLTTLPAIATTLLGVAVGVLIREPEEDPMRRMVRLFVFGSLLTAAGYAWSWLLPLNKSLWTSSYAVFTAGIATSTLALFLWFADMEGHRRWTRPLAVYGLNPLAVFVGSGLLAKTLLLIQVAPGDAAPTSLQRWIFETLFLPLAAPVRASLIYALVWVLMWGIVLRIMERRGWVLKV